MQHRDLPQLHFLPAFEAAGRLGSFKAAAVELHLTPSAISQQLKALEDSLGSVLFERRARAIRLTSAGAAYLGEIQQALSDIARASRRVRQNVAPALRLSTADFIAYEFLLPRLSQFRARFDGLELNLEPTSRVIDLATSEVDIAIRVADGPWPGACAHVLGAAVVAPVCSPDLARKIRSVAQLAQHTLIDVRGQQRRGWGAFMKRHGVTHPKLLCFDGYLESLRAAEQGLGVAFGVFPMTTDWVMSGRLAVPLATRMPLAAPIALVHRATDARAPLYAALVEWLRAQYASLPALPNGRVLVASAPAAPSAARSNRARRKRTAK